MPLHLCAIPIALACSTAAFAQSTPAPAPIAAPVATPVAPAPDSDVRTLTDEQRLAILDGNTVESAAAARGELPGSDVARRAIHGEVGVAVGTGGMRSVYGVADIPLGDHAGATVAFESTRFGNGYRR